MVPAAQLKERPMFASHTVVVASSESNAAGLVESLSNAGFSVVGPIGTAAMTLAMAAQKPVTVAVVENDLDGDSGGSTLADDLLANWGVPSVVLSGDRGWRTVGAWDADAAVRERLGEVVRTFKNADPEIV
jgi:hypothetical protein